MGRENAAISLSRKAKDMQNSLESQLATKVNKNEVTNVMTPKGKVSYTSLPATGNVVGWYYYCPDGDGTNGKGNYIWNGTSWYFGGTGDEGYNILKEEIGEFTETNIIFQKKHEEITGTGTYVYKRYNIYPNKSGKYTLRIDSAIGSKTVNVASVKIKTNTDTEVSYANVRLNLLPFEIILTNDSDYIELTLYGSTTQEMNGDTAVFENVIIVSGYGLDRKIRKDIKIIGAEASANILYFGANNTGLVSCSELINALLEMYDSIYIPNGVYKCDTKIILKSRKKIIGESQYGSVLLSNISDYLIETLDGSINCELSNLTLNGNSKGGGLHLTASSNSILEGYDAHHHLSNLYIKNCYYKNSLRIDQYIRECRFDNLHINGNNYNEPALNCNGTDNFFTNITIQSCDYVGASFAYNNTVQNLKTFLCGKINGRYSVELWGGYNILTNLSCQQNYGGGLRVHANSCAIDAVFDSNGYGNSFIVSNLLMEGSYNNIRGTSVNGRFGSKLDRNITISSGNNNLINLMFEEKSIQPIELISGDTVSNKVYINGTITS
jgi:hypothetical protein